MEVRRQAVFWLSEVHSDRAIVALDSILHGSTDSELQEKAIFAKQADAPSCASCGSIMIRSGTCYRCGNCGSTSGCS